MLKLAFKFNAKDFFQIGLKKYPFFTENQKVEYLWGENFNDFAISRTVWELLTFYRFYLTCGKI